MADLHRVQFETASVLEGKALTEQDDGTLILEGYVADLDIDRESDYFMEGALGKAISDYMKNPVVIYNHVIKPAPTLLGRTLKLELHEGKGLWGKVAIPKPEPGTERMNHYKDIKSGLLRGFSVGGFFNRVRQAGKSFIDRMDMVELSITPTPVNPRTLGALAGKALSEYPVEDGLDLSRLDAIERAFAALSH